MEKCKDRLEGQVLTTHHQLRRLAIDVRRAAAGCHLLPDLPNEIPNDQEALVMEILLIVEAAAQNESEGIDATVFETRLDAWREAAMGRIDLEGTLEATKRQAMAAEARLRDSEEKKHFLENELADLQRVTAVREHFDYIATAERPRKKTFATPQLHEKLIFSQRELEILKTERSETAIKMTELEVQIRQLEAERPDPKQPVNWLVDRSLLLARLEQSQTDKQQLNAGVLKAVEEMRTRLATIEQGSTKLHEDQTRSLADAKRKADDAQALLQEEQAAREKADQRVAQLLRAIKDKDRLRSVGLKERHIEQNHAVEETACILAESREMRNEITGLRDEILALLSALARLDEQLPDNPDKEFNQSRRHYAHLHATMAQIEITQKKATTNYKKACKRAARELTSMEATSKEAWDEVDAVTKFYDINLHELQTLQKKHKTLKEYTSGMQKKYKSLEKELALSKESCVSAERRTASARARRDESEARNLLIQEKYDAIGIYQEQNSRNIRELEQAALERAALQNTLQFNKRVLAANTSDISKLKIQYKEADTERRLFKAELRGVAHCTDEDPKTRKVLEQAGKRIYCTRCKKNEKRVILVQDTNPCYHTFCRDCINTCLLAGQATCPSCKLSFDEKAVRPFLL